MIEGAREQWLKPIPWFKHNVKCCANCKHWDKDPTLMGDYKYNSCLAELEKTNKFRMTAFDFYCDNYCGTATEENLIVNLSEEECKELMEEAKKVLE